MYSVRLYAEYYCKRIRPEFATRDAITCCWTDNDSVREGGSWTGTAREQQQQDTRAIYVLRGLIEFMLLSLVRARSILSLDIKLNGINANSESYLPLLPQKHSIHSHKNTLFDPVRWALPTSTGNQTMSSSPMGSYNYIAQALTPGW